MEAATSSTYCTSLQPLLFTSSPRIRRPSISRPNATRSPTQTTSMAHSKEPQQHVITRLGEATAVVSSAAGRLLDAFVESVFTFSRQNLRPTESNFAPVDEVGERVEITEIEGTLPDDFPEGVYIRNGDHQFSSLTSYSAPLTDAIGVPCRLNARVVDIASLNISCTCPQIYTYLSVCLSRVEPSVRVPPVGEVLPWAVGGHLGGGEGMLHALYFTRTNSTSENTACAWSLSYANRYVETDTFRIEKARRRPCFLPVTKGASLAVLAAAILNMLRFGKVHRDMNNTSVFEHAGSVLAAAENGIPYEVELRGLATLGPWAVALSGWNMPFSAHPKVAPGSGELVIYGLNVVKPFLTVGVVSEDGKKLERKVDVKLERCAFCHEIGVTKMYNIILDMPLTLSPSRMLRGAPLFSYDKKSYARIGVMPRYGDAESILWFDVEPFCTLHLVNCFEEGDEVLVRGFRLPGSIIMGPTQHTANGCANQGLNEEYFSRLYEWKLNLRSRAVTGKYLTGTDTDLEFPVINDRYVGLRNRYAYAQVIDCEGSLAGGNGTVRPKFGGFAKLYLEEKQKSDGEDLVHVEYHHLDQNQFCSGATFVPKVNGIHEDDGWLISFVHDEGTDISQAHIIDTQKFQNGPIAKIKLPHRVPYGFHGAFISKNTRQQT